MTECISIVSHPNQALNPNACTAAGSPPPPDPPPPPEDDLEARTALLEETLRLLAVPDSDIEIRAILPNNGGAWRNNLPYRSIPDLARWAALHDRPGIQGVYFVLNPLGPGPREENRFANDNDVLRRRRLVIDIDPVKGAGKNTSATDEEKARAWEVLLEVRRFLDARGFPTPAVIDSGNGYCLIYGIDLPVNDGGLVQRFLRVLAGKFVTGGAVVDSVTFNPSRLVKLYGTTARKGEHTPERPHRQSEVVERPDALETVPTALIQQVAALVPEEKEPVRPAREQDKPADGGRRFLPGVELLSRETMLRRALAYVAKMDPAVEGNSGDKQTFTVACVLVRDFALTVDEARPILEEYNRCCLPPWDRKRLEHKLTEADKFTGERGRLLVPQPENTSPSAGPKGKKSLVVTRLSDVKARPVKWLWYNRIPLGGISLLEGDPGLGKSSLAISVTAAVTRGEALPGDRAENARPPAGVVLLSAEDSLEHTIRPRLDAAGADASLVFTTEIVRTGQAEESLILPYDLDLLEKLIREKGVLLMVIDPLPAYLDAAINSHNDAAVRRALHPVKMLTDRTGCAVVVVRHLNKMPGGPAIYRGGGSIGIIGAARSALVVGRDPADASRLVLASNKCNLAVRPRSLYYSLEAAGEHVARVRWGQECDLTADQILGESDGGSKAPRKRAPEWCAEAMEELLAGGPRPVKEVDGDLQRRGFSDYAIRAARKLLDIEPYKQNFVGPWMIGLAPVTPGDGEGGESTAKGANPP